MIPRHAAIAALLLLVGACASLPEISDGLSLDQRRERLSAIGSWEMRGRIAIDTGEDAYQGRFNWWQDHDELALLIRGPFGAGSVEITGTVDELTVRSRRESWILDDAETELSELLGWWIPVGSLNAWLLGLPDAAYPARTAVSDGVIDELEQRAWTLDYAEYQNAAGLLVPRTIDLKYGALKLVVTIDDWVNRDEDEPRLN